MPSTHIRSLFSFGTVVVSQASIEDWLKIVVLILGALASIYSIIDHAQHRRCKNCKFNPEKLTILALCLSLVAGCTTTKPVSQKPQTTSAAFIATTSARLQIAKAKSQLAKAKVEHPEATQVITATEATLDTADKEVETAGTRIVTLQKEFDQYATWLEQAKVDEKKANDSRDFWKASAYRLLALSIGLILWTFRKPIIIAARSAMGIPAI